MSFECDCCGACCRTYPIFASGEDAVREPRITHEARELRGDLQTPSWRFQLYPLPFHEGCCFLDREQRCTIYDTRPTVCRMFAAGSEQCQEARRRSGLGELRPQSN